MRRLEVRDRDPDLLQVVLALGSTSRLACLLNSREEKCNEDRDDRDYHQEFYK